MSTTHPQQHSYQQQAPLTVQASVMPPQGRIPPQVAYQPYGQPAPQVAAPQQPPQQMLPQGQQPNLSQQAANFEPPPGQLGPQSQTHHASPAPQQAPQSQPAAIDEARLLDEAKMYDISAEVGTLAILMACPHWIEQVASTIPEDAFHHSVHKKTYELMQLHAFQARQAGHDPIADLDSLFQAARMAADQKSLKNGKLWEHVKMIAGRAKTMRQYSPDELGNRWLQVNRTLLHAHRRVLVLREAVAMYKAVASHPDAEYILGRAQTRLHSLSEGGSADHAPQQIGASEIDLTGQRSAGLKPGFTPLLESMLSGYQPGRLYVLCARSGVGKSAFMGHVGLRIAQQRVPVLYLDSEMSREEVDYRHLSALAGINENAIRNGDCQTGDLRQQVDNAIQELRSLQYSHVSIAGMPYEQAVSIARNWRKAVAGNGPALIVYDYIKLPAASASNAKEYQVLGAMTTAIKDLAQELNVPILAGAQANREAVKMGQKQIADESAAVIAGSDRILHLCDALLTLRNLRQEEQSAVSGAFPERDEQHEANRLRYNQALHLIKNRGGPAYEAGVPIYYRRGYATFHEVAAETDEQGRPKRDDSGRTIPQPELEHLHRKPQKSKKNLPDL